MRVLVEDIYARALAVLYEQIQRLGTRKIEELSGTLTDFVCKGEKYAEAVADGIGSDGICLDFKLTLHTLCCIGEEVPEIGILMRDYRQVVFDIYTESQPVIGRVCSSYRLQPDAADDFGQDLYLKLIYKLPLYDSDKASFDTWLSYLVSNQLADVYRNSKRMADSGQANMDSIVGDECVMTFTRDDVDRFYRDACKELDDNERLIIEAVFGVGEAERMSYKEIAKLIGGKAESIRVNKRPRALEKLHKFATKGMVF